MQVKKLEFTPRADSLLKCARSAAESLNHNYIGTEHLLLAMLLEESCTSSKVLSRIGNIQSLKKELLGQMGKGPEQFSLGSIPFTPRTQKVFNLAMKEASKMDNGYCGTEHLLLGILREGDGMANRVLLEAGLTIDKVQMEILRLQVEPRVESQSTDPSYMVIRLLQEEKIRTAIHDVVSRTEDKKFIGLCADIYKHMPLPEDAPSEANSVWLVKKLYQATRIGTVANRNFGTLLQLMTGGEPLLATINYNDSW